MVYEGVSGGHSWGVKWGGRGLPVIDEDISGNESPSEPAELPAFWDQLTDAINSNLYVEI